MSSIVKKKRKQASLIRYILQTLLTVVPLSVLAGAVMSTYVIKLNGAQLKVSIGCFLIAGILLGVFASFKNFSKFIKPLNEISILAENLKNNNVTYVIDAKRKGGQALIIDNLNESVSKLRYALKDTMEVGAEVSAAPVEIKKSIQIFRDICNQVSTAVAELAKGAIEQSESIEKVSSSITGMAEGLGQINSDINGAKELAENALYTIKAGEKSVSYQETKMSENKASVTSVSRAISALADKSKEIGDILVVINGIAEQTNLLSLNAAIEAARAGEQGKGFAVVANEVRKLAEQSGSSVQRIEELIKEVQSDIEKAVQEMARVENIAADQEKAMSDTVGSFAGISKAVSAISVNIKNINIESASIVENAEGAETAISQIAGISEENAAATQQVAASTSEQTDAVQSILLEAEKLSELSEKLKDNISHFTV